MDVPSVGDPIRESPKGGMPPVCYTPPYCLLSKNTINRFQSSRLK